MLNFIFGGFINKHRPLGEPKLPYVFYTLLATGFYSVVLLFGFIPKSTLITLKG